MELYQWILAALAYLTFGFFWLKFRGWRLLRWKINQVYNGYDTLQTKWTHFLYYSEYHHWYMSAEFASLQVIFAPFIFIGMLIILILTCIYKYTWIFLESFGTFAKRLAGINGT